VGKLTFIIGGARSGKSSLALKMAGNGGGRKAYLATAQPLDDEMVRRIEQHKRERSPVWDTIEEPLKIRDELIDLSEKYDVVLLDCLTLWLSNILHTTVDPLQELKEVIEVIKGVPYKLFIISNEVGMGIVPENELARTFRDVAGLMNQSIAAISDEVHTVVAGVPLRIK
jgi:adenosylcobinamide kinase/adenosylcobinamide-phosphate guanylyltransferase